MSAQGGNPASPANELVAVTPSDATVLKTTRGLWVGTGGNIAVLPAGPETNGAAVTVPNVPGGTTLAVSVTKVMATGTTGSNIVAMY